MRVEDCHMPKARVATPFSADVEPPLTVILLGMMPDATDECSASGELVSASNKFQRQSGRIVHEGAMSRDMLYKGGIRSTLQIRR